MINETNPKTKQNETKTTENKAKQLYTLLLENIIHTYINLFTQKILQTSIKKTQIMWGSLINICYSCLYFTLWSKQKMKCGDPLVLFFKYSKLTAHLSTVYCRDTIKFRLRWEGLYIWSDYLTASIFIGWRATVQKKKIYIYIKKKSVLPLHFMFRGNFLLFLK